MDIVQKDSEDTSNPRLISWWKRDSKIKTIFPCVSTNYFTKHMYIDALQLKNTPLVMFTRIKKNNERIS